LRHDNTVLSSCWPNLKQAEGGVMTSTSPNLLGFPGPGEKELQVGLKGKSFTEGKAGARPKSESRNLVKRQEQQRMGSRGGRGGGAWVDGRGAEILN